MAEIDLSLLFPKGQARPTPSRAIEGARKDGLDGEYLLLNGKTSELIKLLKPGQRLEQLYEQVHGKGKKAYFAFSRLHPGQPSRTIAKDSAGLFHYTEDRTLSIGEYKRIASFPDDYQFIGSFTTALQRIGNSVPPMLTRAIAIQIKHALFNGEPLNPYPKTMSYLEILESAWLDHLKPKAPDAPTVISTFAGGGGSSLGYSMAGYRELLAVEWDDNAVATFKLNFPEIPVYHGDIAKLSVEECLKLAGLQPGELDLLDGSPPCQGFSTAGKRILDDPRNQLFREYVRLLRGLQPKVFLMENVSGMVKGKMKLVFAEIMRELKASGYRVSARLMNAMYFNVPQSRQRMIFIGVREDLGIEPSHPKGESKPTNAIRLDDKPARYSPKRYGDVLIRNRPATTIARLQRLFWDETHEFGLKSYSVCASFPLKYRWVGEFQDAKNRIGNSVPPLFIRSIAAHIWQEILDRIDT